MNLVMVGLGGAAGSILRYLMSAWVMARLAQPQFPAGTFAVNLTGCLVIGLLAGLWINHPVAPQWKLLLITGLLGGFTTFSAFSLEMLLLAQQHHWSMVLLYAAGSVVFGLAMAWGGFWLGQQW